MRALLPAVLLATVVAAPMRAQSLLERSPNLHGVWTLPGGSAAFIFAHRFEFLSGGDELFNVPTLTLGMGLPLGLTAGLDYTSYSEAIPGRVTGNETQYWLKRALPTGEIADVSALVAYNSAAKSWDGAVNVSRTLRSDLLFRGLPRAAVFGELRGFSDRFGSGDPGLAGGIGAAVRLTEYLGVTGDVGRVLDEDSIPSTWSAALAVGIPGTPHTFSLQATNGGAITLQGASRKKVAGAEHRVRYGFVFTVPLTGSRWSRIFGSGPPAAPPAAPIAQAAIERPDTAAARVEMKLVA